MNGTHEIKWLIGAADELAGARRWLEENAPGGGWQLDLLGLEEDKTAAGGARIAVRCRFADKSQAHAFASGFLNSAPAPLVPRPPSPETEADAAFAAGARQILAGPEPISAGKLHFLGLEHVQAHFGDQWPKLASRAEALVRRAIERRLTPQDVYRKTGDLNFVVMFANLSGREADLKCSIIAEEIGRMLVGDELGNGMLAVKSVATEIDGPAMLRKLEGSLDVAQAIESEVEVERLRREAPPPKGEFDCVAPADPLAGLHFMYRPIWDVRRSAVANYQLLPGRALPGGRWRHGDLLEIEELEVRRRLDELVIDRVMADLAGLQRQGRRLVISFPISFDSISTTSRRNALIMRWRTLPLDYRRLGVFEVVGVPDGIPQGRVAEIANHLRMESRGVLMRVPLQTVSFRNFSDTGILAIGAELGVVTSSEERLMATFRDFVTHAERARLVTYIHGLRSFSLTIGAIGAGFAFVDGDPVSSISEQPEEAYRFGLHDLYSQRLGSRDAARPPPSP